MWLFDPRALCQVAIAACGIMGVACVPGSGIDICEQGDAARGSSGNGPASRSIPPLAAGKATLSESGQPPITSHSDFRDVCSSFVVGYQSMGGPRLFPKWGNFVGDCRDNSAPIAFSVTHENDRNNHKGAANYDPNIVSYMGDLNVATDLGRWINASFHDEGADTILSLSLNTIDYQQINVTGWPLQFGHLFLGANDRSAKASLDGDIAIDFDIRVRKNELRPELYPDGYSGHRVLVGTQLTWDEEPPRTNKVHYLEVDLLQSDRYALSYGEPRRSLCKDAIYDRCFYSDNGEYAEGRGVDYQAYLENPPIPISASLWSHVHLPLSRIYKRLAWVSRPKSWSAARLSGLYFGIETAGATQTVVELRRYRAYVRD